MMLVEFVRDRETKEPATPDDTLAIVRQAVANGVIVMRAGLYSNGIRLLPPLTMPEDMLREGLDALGRAIRARGRSSGRRRRSEPTWTSSCTTDIVLTQTTPPRGVGRSPCATAASPPSATTTRCCARRGPLTPANRSRRADARSPDSTTPTRTSGRSATC